MGEKLGQHFLRDRGAVDAVIAALDPEIKTVIEIGPGKGALTKPLAEALQKIGGRLFAVEKDPRLAEEARAWAPQNLEITEGDILRALPTLAPALAPESYALVGNIPYYLTGFLLRKISELENKPKMVIFMVQKEVAERAVASPPDMNRLAASVRFWAEPKILRVVPKKSFSPPPKVDSALILLKTKAGGSKIPGTAYYSAVRALFAQPRKTVLNNLSFALRSKGGGAPEKALKALRKAGVHPSARPQNLSVRNIEEIAEFAEL